MKDKIMSAREIEKGSEVARHDKSSEASSSNGVSRGNFLVKSTGVVAGAAALAMGASKASAAVSPPEPDSPDTSIRWKTPPGDLCNEKLGYADVGATAGFPERAGNNYGLSAGVGFSESPTISFSMPESDKYYGRLLAPLSAKQITSLVLGGFDSEDVFLTTARGVNGLRNISAEFENTPEENAAFSDFAEAFSLMKKRRSLGLVDIELGGKQTDYSSPVTIVDSTAISKVLLLGAASYALANDSELVKYDNDVWQTHRYEKNMALRFAPAAKNSPDARRLRELLNLDDRYNFPMVDAEMVNAEKSRGVLGQAPGALDPSIIWAEIGLRGRSMLEIMQVASKKVQIPEEEVARGVAFVDANQGATRDTGLVIKSSKSEPDSILRTKYRGYWFYIDDSDLESRKQFALLNALFAVVGGTVPGANPIMTIPVGL